MQDVNPPGGFENPVNRVYATHGAQPYHTDSSDLVALLCLRPAKVGGYSTWASSYSIYNALLQTQPELVEALAEEWYLDRKDEIPDGEGPWFKLPVFSWYKVRICTHQVAIRKLRVCQCYVSSTYLRPGYIQHTSGLKASLLRGIELA